MPTTTKTCPTCHGAGIVGNNHPDPQEQIDDSCPTCGEAGRVTVTGVEYAEDRRDTAGAVHVLRGFRNLEFPPIVDGPANPGPWAHAVEKIHVTDAEQAWMDSEDAYERMMRNREWDE